MPPQKVEIMMVVGKEATVERLVMTYTSSPSLGNVKIDLESFSKMP
jgi:hypothetical protein